MNLPEALAAHFALNGFQWRDQDGNLFTPNEEELAEALDNIKSTLYAKREELAEGEYAELEAGYLFVADRNDHMDVYVYVGEINNE